jgi:hypothetical protein
MENFSVVSRGFDERSPLFKEDLAFAPDNTDVSRPHILTLTPILHGGSNVPSLIVQTNIASQIRNSLRRIIRQETSWSDTQINRRLNG